MLDIRPFKFSLQSISRGSQDWSLGVVQLFNWQIVKIHESNLCRENMQHCSYWSLWGMKCTWSIFKLQLPQEVFNDTIVRSKNPCTDGGFGVFFSRTKLVYPQCLCIFFVDFWMSCLSFLLCFLLLSKCNIRTTYFFFNLLCDFQYLQVKYTSEFTKDSRHLIIHICLERDVWECKLGSCTCSADIPFLFYLSLFNLCAHFTVPSNESRELVFSTWEVAYAICLLFKLLSRENAADKKKKNSNINVTVDV